MRAAFRTTATVILLTICIHGCTTSSAINNTLANDAGLTNKNSTEYRGCPDILKTLNDVVRQLEDKKTTRFPPVDPERDGTVVPAQINLLPLRLLRVDDARNQLELDILVHVFWHDPRLAWANTTTYDNDCTPKLPARLSLRDIRNIWTPIFVLAEFAASTKRGLHEIFESMQISQNGSVFYVGRYRGDLVCPMKRRFYPFDEQVCNITVLGGGFIRYEVGSSTAGHHTHGMAPVMNISTTINDSEDFMRLMMDSYTKTIYEAHIFGREMTTSEWDLNPTDDQLVASLTQPIAIKHPLLQPYPGIIASSTREEDIEAQSLVFQLYIKRNSWPLIWTMIIPPIVISTTAVAGLYLGCPPNSRFTFGSSVVVTLSLLIRSLNKTLEAGDDGNPLLEWLYLGLFLTTILATTLSLIPHALAKRIKKKRRGKNDVKQLGAHAQATFRRNCFWLARTVGVEETINICFASYFLSLQAILIGYVVISWKIGTKV